MNKKWCRLALAAIIFVAVLFALISFIFPTYTATAWIQVQPSKPYYVFAENQHRDYTSFVNTQIALMRSPLIIEKALENPVLANIPELVWQKDRVGWLGRKLQFQINEGGEILTVSFTAHQPKDAEDIVNSVVNAYFEYYESQSNEWNAKLINQLNLELNRQQNAARFLQDEIRAGMREAAKKGGAVEQYGALSGGMAQGESLRRDLYLQEAKLEGLRAELRATKEFLDKPEMPEGATFKLKQSLLETEIAVRAQEILIESLRTHLSESVRDASTRTVEIADVSFQQEQLKRINMVLDLLQTRIVALHTEMNAPAQIQLKKKATLPKEADRWWCIRKGIL